MPEGHTVHRLARTFLEVFAGKDVDVTSPQGRFTQGAALLNGGRLLRGEAYGKQMFLGFEPPSDPHNSTPSARRRELDDADLMWLRVHLGLYGSWTFAADTTTNIVHAIGAPRRRIGERDHDLDTLPSTDSDTWSLPEPRGQVRVRIAAAHAVADLTGPTACEVITHTEVLHYARKLGPDPIRADAEADRFIAAAQRSRSAIGALLMNQAVIAGVGNIYRAEVLFRAGLSPFTPGATVPAETLTMLWKDLVSLMRDGAITGAIVTTEPADRTANVSLNDLAEPRPVTRQNTDGTPGAVPRDESFYVYHRHGQPCRHCGTLIALTDMQARKLYWCPTCQV